MPERDTRRGRQRPPFSRETNLLRSVNTRQQNRAVLIVTDGKETEPAYFRKLRTDSWVLPGKVEVIFHKGDPAAAVERAITEAPGYTEAWVVCDVDDYDVEPALANARRGEITVALSKPCFEVWLILHLAEGCGAFDNATKVGKRLKELLPAWDKTALDYHDFREGVLEAEQRAKRLAEVHGEPPKGNPSTDVWKLIESLRTTPRRH